MTKEAFSANNFQYIMCSIIVWDVIDIILVCEENWLWGDFVLPLFYIWWDKMWLWKWYANLS